MLDFIGFVLISIFLLESKPRDEQIVKFIKGEFRYKGLSYKSEDISKLLSVFFEEKRFDDNICISFVNEESREVEIKEVSAFILNGYKEFISDLKVENRIKYKFELILILDSYSSEYSRLPFLLQNEKRRLGQV